MATVTTQIIPRYSDLDLNFVIHPVKKDINILTSEMAVINSIKNLILTNHYERPFQPQIGSNVRRMLFENMDNITATTIENEIKQTIANFEPRASVSKIFVVADYENNGFKVTLNFFVINRTTPITINFFLERIR
jgi:phage baseplate assembly protein W